MNRTKLADQRLTASLNVKTLLRICILPIWNYISFGIQYPQVNIVGRLRMSIVNWRLFSLL